MSTKKKHPPRPADLTPSRRRVFTAIMVLVPVLALAALEGALRLSGYGPDLRLFTTEQIAGRTYFIMNPDVKARYFTHVEFSPNTSPDYFSVPKPPGTFRIFCLGGSTTVGYPYGYAGSFAAFLRDRLRATFPDRKIEVINLGMTATNSFTVNDIARELPAYEPDLLVVYDGHNEFYGALGVASNESSGRSPWLVRLYLRLIHVRSFQLLRQAYAAAGRILAGPPAADPGTMMERLAHGQYVPLGSGAYRAGIAAFSDNVAALASFCAEEKIPLLLGTQVSNLRDLPPLDSEGRTRDEFRGDPAAVEEAARAALRRDSLAADAHYALARALLARSLPRDAEAEFIRARDCDALRFRAATDQNAVIRAATAPRNGIFVADHEAALRAEARDSIIGGDLILEHLHPNVRGYFLIAKEYARAMRAAGLLAAPAAWAGRDTVSDGALMAASPLTELDMACAARRTVLLTSGWPFTPQTAPAPARVPAAGLDDITERAVRGVLTWEQAHVAAAEFYTGTGDDRDAAREYRALIRQFPLNVSPYLALAHALIRQDSADAAAAVLRQSLAVEPTVHAYRVLGSMELNRGALPEAIALLKDAAATDLGAEDYPESCYLLALAYARNHQPDLAVAQLRPLLQRYPEFTKASTLLRALQKPR